MGLSTVLVLASGLPINANQREEQTSVKPLLLGDAQEPEVLKLHIRKSIKAGTRSPHCHNRKKSHLVIASGQQEALVLWEEGYIEPFQSHHPEVPTG
ncbi:Unconventional Myosin-Xviiia [Manis pentadactyla]|nr:Unconventional Myosin-Xviiia [Manis pentadactyla]